MWNISTFTVWNIQSMKIFKIDHDKMNFFDILFLFIVQIFVMFAFCYAILDHLFDLLLTLRSAFVVEYVTWNMHMVWLIGP